MNKIFTFILFIGLIVYVWLRYAGMGDFLFNPYYAGNDARQQLFPLYSVFKPEIFKDDLIMRSMKAYIAPLHWFISSNITRFTLNPVTTGHIVMFLQLSLVSLFIFLSGRRFASTMTGLVSVLWIVHTPDLMNNLVGGLSRSWSGVVIAAFLCSLAYGRQYLIILTLLLGCMLHPPSAFCAIASYSIFLALSLMLKRDRQTLLQCVWFALACPIIYLTAFYTVERPPEIGKMVTLKEASKMPVFNKKGGRFPFVPLKSPYFEFKTGVFKTFTIERSKIGKDIAFWSISSILVIVLLLQIKLRQFIIPLEIWSLLLGILSSYFLARIFAFQLYVPSRYLGWPLALFIMTSIPIMIWRLISLIKESGKLKNLKSFLPTISYSLLIAIVICIGGSGYTYTGKHFKRTIKQLDIYLWIRDNLPENALIAGHPSGIDGIQLYGMRRGFITTETYHPFYSGYYKETSRRITQSFRALYSTNLNEFLDIMEKEKIDFFVFHKKYFKPNKKNMLPRLNKANYFKPHDRLVLKLASQPEDSYLYFRLVPKSLRTQVPFIKYNTKDAAILDIKKLREFISKNGAI